MNSARAHARFVEAPVARLATASRTAQPHLVPVTFAVLDNVVVTAVDDKPKRDTRLKRLRNIAENSSVSLIVDHYEPDWSQLWWVRADGEAEITDTAEHPASIRALVSKYPRYQQRTPDGALIVIHVHRWSGWHA